MFRFKHSPSPRSRRIDLETVRETMVYIRDDVAAEPELSEVADALEQAICALDTANLGGKAAKPTQPLFSVRFFPNR